MKSRRKFLSDCSAVGLAALATPVSLLASAPSPLRRRSLDELSREDFAAQLSTQFRLHAPGGRGIGVRLAKIRVWPADPLLPGHESFSLFFTGHGGERIEQETYLFEHEVLGRFACFIVPVSPPGARSVTYEMMCNRRRRPTI